MSPLLLRTIWYSMHVWGTPHNIGTFRTLAAVRRGHPEWSKKLKRSTGQSVIHGQDSGPGAHRVQFLGDQWRPGGVRVGQRGRYGLGAPPGLRHGDGLPRAAGAHRRKPHLTAKAQLKGRLRLSDASEPRLARSDIVWAAISSPSPRWRSRTPPGLVPHACRPQIRWLESPAF